MSTRFTRWVPAVLLLIAGCVPCLHPLYTDNDLVFDPSLIGIWKVGEGPETLTFSKSDQDNAYKMVYADKDGKTGEFVAHLLKLKGTVFLDLYPADPQMAQNDFYKAHLFAAHTFYRVDQIAPKLQLASMNYDWVKKLVEENPKALKHEIESDKLLITASTADLQQFVLDHLKTDGAWANPNELTRVDSPPAPKP